MNCVAWESRLWCKLWRKSLGWKIAWWSFKIMYMLLYACIQSIYYADLNFKDSDLETYKVRNVQRKLFTFRCSNPVYCSLVVDVLALVISYRTSVIIHLCCCPSLFYFWSVYMFCSLFSIFSLATRPIAQVNLEFLVTYLGNPTARCRWDIALHKD